MTRKPGNLAQRIVGRIFAEKYDPNEGQVVFTAEEISATAGLLGDKPPRNPWDIVYSLRNRTPLPENIQRAAPPGHEWAIFPGGKSVYVLRLVAFTQIKPRQGIRTIRLPDSTPGIIAKYSLNDEQALLARLRYNRLLDVFTGLACYPLQSHLRTSLEIKNAIDVTPTTFQIETDDLYVGLDKHGAHYVLPVQAKSVSETLGIIQIWQDFRMAEQKFPDLRPQPIAAQFMRNNAIALFGFEETADEITIARERHYQLVPPDTLSAEELASYRATARRAFG